jgi:hypothetical protein
MAQLLLKTMQGEIPLRLAAMDKAPSCWINADKLQLLGPIYSNEEPVQARNFFDILGKEKITGSDGEIASQMNVLHILARNCRVVFSGPSLKDQWVSAVESHATDLNLLHAKYLTGKEEWPKGRSRTPFGCLLCRILTGNGLSDLGQAKALQVWTGCLVNVGRDLHSYGEVKHRIFHEDSALCTDLRSLNGFLDFSYGAKPTDWHLWFQHPGDVYAGIFWELVERRHYYVPGSRVEEEDISEYDQRRSRLRPRDHRYTGIKRRILRRLKAKAKCTECFSSTVIKRIEKLRTAVDSNARNYIDGRIQSDAAREVRKWMFELAMPSVSEQTKSETFGECIKNLTSHANCAREESMEGGVRG